MQSLYILILIDIDVYVTYESYYTERGCESNSEMVGNFGGSFMLLCKCTQNPTALPLCILRHTHGFFAIKLLPWIMYM